jgi:hypothetical protein
MKQRILALATATLLLLGMLPSSALASSAGPTVNFRGGLPLSPHYAQAKAALDATAPQSASDGPGERANAPTTLLKFKGQSDPTCCSPGDPTGAIGPTEYVEIVNEMIGVYDRTGHLLSQNSEGTFTGFGAAASGDGSVMYDVQDQRFYFSMLWISGTNYQLGFGFSKGSAPSANASDWCSYNSTFGVYGSTFPDYPKLGQTSDFILIGVNRFDHTLTTYLGSDVAWATKPAPGTITTCPALSSITVGAQQSLLNADGSLASTPVPGRQTDDSSTGYVVANHDVSSGGSAQALSVFSVTKNTTTGLPSFSGPTTVSVRSYSMPPSAPQKGTTFKLDTLDGRLMNAWLAPDPNQGGAVALWTQHTVKASSGGLGAEVRWYEINPTTGALFQSGVAHSPSLYVFIGAVSPDRNGATGQFGGNMVLGFSTSSSTQDAAAAMVSKVGANPQSSIITVANSTKPETDFTCSSTAPCRWGDYHGASPDPASTTAGQVWLTVGLTSGGSAASAGWTTVNWEAQP